MDVQSLPATDARQELYDVMRSDRPFEEKAERAARDRPKEVSSRANGDSAERE